MRLRPENIPYGYAILVCQTCKGQIGLFKPEDLAVPMVSGMFKSIDEHHGFPPPFPVVPGRNVTMKWEFARCPFCGRRPFMQRDAVMTPNGLFKVGDPLIPRKETQEDKNQRALAKEWGKYDAEQKTLEDKNQETINKRTEFIASENIEVHDLVALDNDSMTVHPVNNEQAGPEVEDIPIPDAPEEIKKPKRGRPFGWRKQK